MSHAIRRLLRRQLSAARRTPARPAAPRIEAVVQVEDLTLYRSDAGHLWLHNSDAGGLPVDESAVAKLLREYWNREF